MVAEGTTVIFITFLLAIIGYAGLTITLLLSLKKKIPFLFWRIIAAIILIHVIMVWIYRYEWQFSLAVRNGYTGFIIFHAALMMILISAIVQERITLILIRFSFIVVTMGAVGASFKYDVVAIYRLPVVICALVGIVGLLWMFTSQNSKRL